jgi:hypothetical protein
MTDETPRRSKREDAPEAPQGYRQTRRASKSAKSAKRAESQHKMSTALGRTMKTGRDVGYYLAVTLGAILVGILIFVLVATAVNGIVRWAARNSADKVGSRDDLESRAKENLLIIGEQNGRAVGFIAARVDSANKQIYGIAIPDGAFIEVPGQGFERVGESYSSGPDISLSAISNYLMVPFRSYIVVPSAVYADAMKKQSIAAIPAASTKTNLSSTDMANIKDQIAVIPAKNTAIVPLPVKPIKLGTQTYFEPQRTQVADLLKSWWGVDASKAAQATRVILYNGAGSPGIAGDAAQPLIRAGFRVVDTKNADNFNYQTTQIVVQRGSLDQGKAIAKVLGVGSVKQQPSDQDVADVIVIVGKDFKPPAGGK